MNGFDQHITPKSILKKQVFLKLEDDMQAVGIKILQLFQLYMAVPRKLKDQHDMDSRLCFTGHSDDDLDLFLDDALPQLDDGLGDTIDSHDLDRNKAACDVWADR